MSSRTFSVTKSTRGKLRELTGLDANVLARYNSMVITSPNAGWVPKPYLDTEQLQRRADGRFGYIDPYQWPQIFCHSYSWGIAIPAKACYPFPSAMSWAWYSPRYDDFVLQKDSAHGNLNRTTLNGLKGLLNIIQGRRKGFSRGHHSEDARKRVEGGHSTLQKVWHVLEHSHLAWRDTVIQLGDYQRIFLDLYAIMDFHQLIESPMLMRNGQAQDSPADPRWLGAFTRAPLMAEQLFATGVAVWLIREEAEVPQDIVIMDIVDVREPTDIVIHNYLDPVGQFAWPFEVVYRGTAGDEPMHAKIREITYIAKEHGQAVVPSNDTGRNQRVNRTARESWSPYTKNKPVVPPMKRELWEISENVFLPAPIPAVSTLFPCLKSKVDSKKLTTDTNSAIGWRFPDPGMLTAVQSVDTMRRYFSNWLAIRPAWIQHVIAHPRSSPPTSKLWRAFLLSTPADLNCERSTESAKERSRALELFHEVLPAGASGMTWAGDDSATFRHESIQVYKRITPAQARAITWELYELHFQFDMLALDQVLAPKQWRDFPAEREALWHEVFPLKTIEKTWDAPLPTQDNGIFRTTDEHDKFSMLNTFARLLSVWPSAPSYFCTPITSSLGSDKVNGAMTELLDFYARTFYCHNGRPPLCPRHVP